MKSVSIRTQPATFMRAVLFTVVTYPNITESDLFDTLRGSWNAHNPAVYGLWSFGTADVRHILNTMVDGELLTKHRTFVKGSGCTHSTRYTLGPRASAPVQS